MKAPKMCYEDKDGKLSKWTVCWLAGKERSLVDDV